MTSRSLPSRSLPSRVVALLSTALLTVLVALFSYGQPAQGQEGAANTPLQEAQKRLLEAFAKTQELVDSEEYDKAIEAYTQIIKATGGFNPTPYIKRAEVYSLLENYEKAIDDLNDALTYAIDLPKVVAEAEALRGEIYLEQGDIGRAFQDLTSATKEIRENAKLQFLLGKVQIIAGQVPAGLETFKLYEELQDPEFEDRETEFYRLRSQAYTELRRFEEAQADLDRAIEIDPTDHENYLSRARIFMAEQSFSAAAASFADAIQNYQPEDENNTLPPISAYLARAAALEEVGRATTDPSEEKKALNEAKATVEALLSALPQTPGLEPTQSAAQFRLGVTERLLGNLPAAIDAFTSAIDLNPAAQPEFQGQVYFRRGICYFYTGEEELALLDFDAASARMLADPRGYLWAGRTYAQEGKYLEAIRSYGEALAISDRYTEAHVHRGLAYFRIGDYERANTDFNNAIRIKPKVAVAYYYRGVVYSLLEKSDKAIASLTKAIERDPRLIDAHRALADELRKSGQSDLASEYDRRAAELKSPANAS